MMPHHSLEQLGTPVKRLDVGETLVRRNPLYFPGAARRFAWLATAPLAERRKWTARRLSRLLRIAARTPYGRRVGAGADLEGWPLLEPAMVRERPGDHMRPGWWTIHSSTGGTTGIPLPLSRSPQSVAVEQAALDHLLRARGVDPRRARVAVLRGDDIKEPDDLEPPFWRPVLGGRRLIFSSNHLNSKTLPAYLEALRAFAADYWWVYPTTLESLIRLGGTSNARPRVPLILSSSEVLSAWCRSAAHAAFGAQVIDYYGQAERAAFAYSLEPGAWTFLPGYAHVELIPHPAEPGEARYEIAGTGLWNQAMPLPRYRTGDLIRAPAPLTSAEIEETTLGVRPFCGVLGRDGDILIAPDGARLTGIDHFHRGVDHIVRVQVVQDGPARVEVRVIPTADFGDADRARLLSNVRLKVPSTMEVEIRLVDALEHTPLGKTPFVIRRGFGPGPGAGVGA